MHKLTNQRSLINNMIINQLLLTKFSKSKLRIASLFFLFQLFIPLGFFSNVAAAEQALGSQGMVVSEHALASQIGIDILKQGGNAVDAAVAVGYALAVVYPSCGNIGGGGFMLIRLANGQNIFLNFREKAPLAATTNLFNKKNASSIEGYLAVATPGTVLGLETALMKYGTLSREVVMAPAIKLADQGFVLAESDIKKLAEGKYKLNKPFSNRKVGERLIQTSLAHSLKLISQNGPQAFYEGPIAKAIVTASNAKGGILSLKDFSLYRVEEYAPIACNYKAFTVISAPPPSAGGIQICEMLNILEDYPLSKWGFNSAQSIHYTVEAMRFSFKDRRYLGDPKFINNPVQTLISKEYANSIRDQIPEFKAAKIFERKEAASSGGHETTHYAIVDSEGNIAAVTVSLNSFFGAGVIADDTGFFLNNQMDDFNTQIGQKNQFGLIQSIANNIEPQKTPLSSMSPTIVLKGQQPILILGAAGGPAIITATLQTILNVLNYQMKLNEAVNAPRFHHQLLPDEIKIEVKNFSETAVPDPDLSKITLPKAGLSETALPKSGLSETAQETLRKMGYTLTPVDHLGVLQAIGIDPNTKIMEGVTDNRRPGGRALGY